MSNKHDNTRHYHTHIKGTKIYGILVTQKIKSKRYYSVDCTTEEHVFLQHFIMYLLTVELNTDMQG